jgi:alpha-D-ribose 1-methylphosphonate 5-triphosphate diphosphatase
MIEAAWRTVEQTGITLPAAIAMIAEAPARMARLPDRGRLEAGLRADLVQVRPVGDIPVVRRVWREGARVA